MPNRRRNYLPDTTGVVSSVVRVINSLQSCHSMKHDSTICRSFSFESFLKQLSENLNTVFQELEQRNWLKIDLATAQDNWQQLFHDYNMEKRGEIYYFQMETNNNPVEYYVYEIKDGLLMFFSLSKREEYNSTLKLFIKYTPGITNMWLPFRSFESTINFITSSYFAHISSFTARRLSASKYPAKIREDKNRYIRYSGSDAGYALSELKEIYGVLPTTIDFKIKSNKLRIKNDGFILIQNINLEILRIVEEIIDQAIAEPIRLRDISKQVLFTTKSKWHNFTISKLMSGKITFDTDIDVPPIHQLFCGHGMNGIEEDEELPRFSFIATNISEEPLSYSATVVDEDKGTVFGISGSSDRLILVPKHRAAFESFINFYRLINETIDESSNLYLFNEPYDK